MGQVEGELRAREREGNQGLLVRASRPMLEGAYPSSMALVACVRAH